VELLPYRLRSLLVRHVHGVRCHLTKALGMHLHATHRFADVLASKKSIPGTVTRSLFGMATHQINI